MILLDEITILTKPMKESLMADGWTVEKLSTAHIKELTPYKGIGIATAEKVIMEATDLFNAEELRKSINLTPIPVLVNDLIKKNFTLQSLALSHIRDLEVCEGIDTDLATRIISYAQDEINKLGLLGTESKRYSGVVSGRSPAFPEDWLSGKVTPPQMSVRVKRNFEQAKAAYDK